MIYAGHLVSLGLRFSHVSCTEDGMHTECGGEVSWKESIWKTKNEVGK